MIPCASVVSNSNDVPLRKDSMYIGYLEFIDVPLRKDSMSHRLSRILLMCPFVRIPCPRVISNSNDMPFRKDSM